MENREQLIKQLLNEKKDLERQINDANFKGYPEIKEISGKKYVYLRYKKYDRLSSKYAGVYSEDFYNGLKDLSRSIKELKTKLRGVNTKLAKLGISIDALPPNVLLNIDYVRNNINNIIYEQAVVEGVSATFLDTEEILEKGSSRNVSFDDTLTILNLKNAWQYVLDEDTVRQKMSFWTLTAIAGYVNDRQISYPDELRSAPARISGSSYRPKIPNKEEVINSLDAILSGEKGVLTAIDLLCYLAKTQVFNNGNKRTALIFANLYLIKNSLGYISIPDNLEKEYKMLLVEYYEDKNTSVKNFLLDNCYYSLHN